MSHKRYPRPTHGPPHEPIAQHGLRIWLPVNDEAFLASADKLRKQTRNHRGIEIRTKNTKRPPAIHLVGTHALRQACLERPNASNTPVSHIIDAIHEAAPGIKDGFTINFIDLITHKNRPSPRNPNANGTHFALRPSIESTRVLETVQTKIRSTIEQVAGVRIARPSHSPGLTTAIAKNSASEHDIAMLSMYYRALTQENLDIHVGPLMFEPDPIK